MEAAIAALILGQSALWCLQVCAWLTERAQRVEQDSGQLHTAAHLLQLAQQFDPEDALARQLSTVASLQDGLQGNKACKGTFHLTVV